MDSSFAQDFNEIQLASLPTGATNTREGGKIRDFRQIARYVENGTR